MHYFSSPFNISMVNPLVTFLVLDEDENSPPHPDPLPPGACEKEWSFAKGDRGDLNFFSVPSLRGTE